MPNGEAPPAIQAILDQIEKLEAAIARCEAILDEPEISEEQRERAKRCIRKSKRELRNLKSLFRNTFNLPTIEDPRRHR